jgi:hypothetical protein
MDYVNPISFPFVKWFAASVCRVKVLAVILIAGGLWSFADVWLEQRDGSASVRFVRSQASATLADKPDEFTRIIRFEVFRSLALILLAVLVQGAASAVSHYDIFAPGQKFKNLGDD